MKSAITTATKHPITLGFSISCDPLQKIKRTYVPFYHSCWWSCKQSDVRPLACRSLKRMEDDNSRTAGLCNQWTYQRWGDTNSQGRLSNYANYVPHLHHSSLTPKDSRWECDDYNIPDKEFFGLSSGDFCKVFVRLGRSK